MPPLAATSVLSQQTTSRLEGAAHELTNVLQIIRGYVSFTHKNLSRENKCCGDLEQALIATDRAAKIAHQLLELARTDNNDRIGQSDSRNDRNDT